MALKKNNQPWSCVASCCNAHNMCVQGLQLLHTTFVIMFISFCYSNKRTTNTVNAEVAASAVTSKVEISDIKLKIWRT
jgi:hypothetical protein